MKLNILLLTVMISYANAGCEDGSSIYPNNCGGTGCSGTCTSPSTSKCFNMFEYNTCKWTCDTNEHVVNNECVACGGGLVPDPNAEHFLRDPDYGVNSDNTNCVAAGGGCDCNTISSDYHNAGCCGGDGGACSTYLTDYQSCGCCSN